MSTPSWIIRGPQKAKAITSNSPPEKLPEPIWDLLYPDRGEDTKKTLSYQRDGVKFMAKRRNSLIADEMGLGKTVQAICFCNVFPFYKRILIICPASLIINWQREISTWSTAKYAAFHVVSYYAAQFEKDTAYDVVIVDEAHFIKNPKSIQHASVAHVCKKAKRILFLTGTPMPNGAPLEIFPLLQILAPSTFDPPGTVKKDGVRIRVPAGEGGGFFKFAKRYCAAHKVWAGRKEVWDFSGASNLEELSKKMGTTVLIRRLKSEVLQELPAKRRQVLAMQPMFAPPWPFDFTSWTEENFEARIAGMQADKKAMSEMFTIRHAQALERSGDAANLLYAMDGKVIVFAHHLDVLEALYDCLKPRGAVLFTGSESATQKQMAVDVFQDDPNCRFFIGSLTAAGTGLTLTAASHVVFVELDFTPKTILQAEDRAHRMGQKESVFVQYLVSDGSIDAHVAKLLVKKFERLEAAGLAGST